VLAVKKCWQAYKCVGIPRRSCLKSVDKLRSVLTFAEEANKKVLASLEKCWHSQKERLKSVGKLGKVLAFAEGAVKKSVDKLRKVLAFPESAV
jgi:uncharacterized protein YaaN involved in tellurite resistance